MCCSKIMNDTFLMNSRHPHYQSVLKAGNGSNKMTKDKEIMNVDLSK